MDLRKPSLQKDPSFPENSGDLNDLLKSCQGVRGLQKIFAEIGNSLSRISRSEESNFVFDLGFRIGLFLSEWQRSDAGLEFQVPGLTAKPGELNQCFWGSFT